MNQVRLLEKFLDWSGYFSALCSDGVLVDFRTMALNEVRKKRNDE